MFGYSRNLGVNSVLEAELHAIVDGLQLAWEQGVRRLVIESDSKTTMDLILGNERRGNSWLELEICNWMANG
ncbi:hypothetical protein Gotur_019897 [Gossypium turneri]